MAHANGAPVIMIGLDAAEYSLIQSWIEEGALPNLARLSRQGASGRLDSTAKWLVGSPWPSFYTSSLPSDHGLYHYLQWRPEMMKHDRRRRGQLAQGAQERLGVGTAAAHLPPRGVEAHQLAADLRALEDEPL